ncbi:exodeoxyribonuclease VII small subunit [Candidatus Latescibacterota bacterium]
MGEKKVPEDSSRDLFGGQEGANEQTFEELLTRLEEIVSQMESGGLSLTESMKLFEEGTLHIKQLSAILGEVREKVLMLVNRENGGQDLENYIGENTS